MTTDDGLLTDVDTWAVSDPTTKAVLPTLGLGGYSAHGGTRGRFERPGRSNHDTARFNGMSSGSGDA
jgi:hypothetical protein